MRVFLLLFVLFFSTFSWGQNKDLEAIRFAVACSAGAQTSPEIETFKRLHHQKGYRTIREKLFAGNSLEQVLSAMLLKHYSSTDLIEVLKQEREKIEQLAKSKRRFTFCFTCTSSEQGTLKQLFAGRKQMTYELVKGRMLNSF